MFRESFFISFITIVCFSKVRSENVTFLHLFESFDTLKLLKGLADFNSTSLCGQHVTELLTDIKSEQKWALLMFDSSAKIPSGFLKGNLVDLGQFDECLAIEHPTRNFTGEYCMLQVNAYRKINGSELNVIELFPSDEISDYLDYWEGGDYSALGFCVPSTCKSVDIENGFNSVFNDSKLDQVFSVKVEKECQTISSINSKSFDWIAWGPLLFFIALSLISTIYDVTYRKSLKDVKPKPLLSAFSLYSNGKYLLQISENPEQLKCLHGIRVLSTFWIVLHHNFIGSSGGINRFESMKTTQDIQHIPLYYGFIAVDTFFFLSGTLTSVVFFRDIKKKGYYDVPLGYIHRYIRLTPSYAAMVFIVAQVYTYLGDGPTWFFHSESSAESCKKYWWTGILYIQNFISSYEMCLGQTWYLAADMQLHWLSPLILYSTFFWSAYAGLIFGAVLLVAVSTNFGVGYIYNLGPNFFFTKNVGLQAEVDYYPFYMRASPYIIGLSTGYFLNKIKNEKIPINLNKFLVLTGWLMSTGLCLAVMYCSIPFAKFTSHSSLENALYLSLHRVAWGFGLSWIVFACLNGYGGPVNAFLSWNIFQPFSKLSYNVYLVHVTVMYYEITTMRTVHYGSDVSMVYNFFSYLTISHLLAIPLTLLFEMPFGNLDKYFFQNAKILPIPRPIEEPKDENYIVLSKAEQNGDNVKRETEIMATP